MIGVEFGYSTYYYIASQIDASIYVEKNHQTILYPFDTLSFL